MFFIFGEYNRCIYKRIKIIWSVFTLILVLLGIRLYVLQVHPAEGVISNYTNKQSESVCDNAYKVFDSNLRDVSSYNNKFVVVIDKKPFSLNNYENTLEELIAFNFIMKNEIEDFNYTDIMKNNGKSYFEVSEETYDKIISLKSLKGVYCYIRKEVDKKYPWKIENIIQNISLSEDEVYPEGSMQNDIYEYIKDNDNIYKDFYVDSDAKYIESGDIIPDDNKNLVLTLDKYLEENIANIINDEKYNDLENIGVMVLESDSGKIKAMLQKDNSVPSINLCMEGGGLEPGSIYKTITLASALEEGKVTMGEEHICMGRICKDEVHGKLTVEKAFVKSCNDIFSIVGEKVSYDTLMDYSMKCGLYNRVLNAKGEAMGKMPKKEDGMDNVAIGQCMTVSPIQMLGAFNTIVNDGVYVKPYLISSVLDKDNNIVKEYLPVTHKVFSNTTISQVKRAMEEVVVSGTGKKASVTGKKIGGKTGSATSGDGNSTHCWFLGYFILNDKKYSMVVLVPNVKNDDNKNIGGGEIASPIFSEIVNDIKKIN